MLKLYLKKEPSTDPVCQALGIRRFDVVAYHDEDCRNPAGRWPSYFSGKPRQGQKEVVLNCWTWEAVWIH